MSDIKALLEKYYNGETSLEEEDQLRDYFALHPEEAGTADGLFLSSIRAVKKDHADHQPAKPRLIKFKYFAIGGTGLAAGIALLIGLRSTAPSTPQPAGPQTAGVQILVTPKVSGEIQDEQQALEQARKALAYVSSKLNKGTAGMGRLNQLEESISKIQNKEKS